MSNGQLRWRSAARVALTVASVSLVAGTAAWNSYWHQVTVALWAHQSAMLAYSIPLSVDGMLLVATFAMEDDKREGRKPRASARIWFWVGAAYSVAANIASTWISHNWGLIPIALVAWPPLALLAVVEIRSRKGKLLSEEPSKNPARVDGGKRSHQTRKARAQAPATGRAPRGRRSTKSVGTNTPAELVESMSIAPTSPAPAGR